MTWTIYRLSDGEMIFNGWPGEDHPSQTGFAFDAQTMGAVASFSDDLQLEQWNPSVQTWTTSLQVVRAKKWAEAEAYRNSRQCEPLPVPAISDGSFVARRDEEGQKWIDRFTGAAITAIMMSETFSISLKDHTGTIHVIGPEDVLQVNAASVLQQAIMYNKGEYIRGLINAATSAAEIEAVDITTGYPPAYEEGGE